MFRGFNLKDSNVDNVKFTLMKNINEPYAEVLKDYVKLISYKFQDCSEMTIEIPNKTFIKGVVQDERLYDLVLGKNQQIIVEIGDEKERFIITQCERTEEVYKGENGQKVHYRTKKLVCKSYEYCLLDKKFICGEDLSRQLYFDKTITTGAIDISDGYLNFLEQDTYWKIKYVSELSKKEFGKAYNEYYIDIADSNILNMAKGTTIWEKDVVINPVGENVVNLKVSYTSIKSYDSNNKLLIDSKKIHDTNLLKLYTGVKHIKAIYDGNDTYRYGIHYQITLSDDVIIDRWEDLGLFLDNQRIVFDGIVLAYADGSEGEISTIKNRSVELGTYSYLDLLRQTISTAFDVIVMFDTYNMEISVYDSSEIGVNSGVEFSYETFVKSINKKDQYDNICNKLVVSSDKASIVDENPFGTSYILDYSYHYNTGLMSEDLMSSWDRYLLHITGKQSALFELRLSKNTLNKKLIQDQAENTELDLAIRDLAIQRVDYVKNNKSNQFDSEITAISTKINTKQDRFATLIISIQASKNSIATIDEQIKTILKDISLEGATDTVGLIFSSDLLAELDSITTEDTLEDDFYSTSLGLYNYAKDKLTKRNKLGIEFDITIEGLLQNIIIPKGTNWNDFIKVGDFVPLVAEDNDILNEDERGMRILSFNYIPCDFDSSNLTLANNDQKDDDLKNASNVGHAINRSTSYINNYKTTFANSITVNDYVDSMLNGDGMNLKATAIRSKSERVKYDQTEAGIYIIDGLNEDKQVYLGASMICFTSDRWLTVKTSMDETGVIAKELIGEIVLSKQLFITTELNEFYIGNIDSITREPSSNGKNFGLLIRENGVNKVTLGIEEDIYGVRKSIFRLIGKKGELVVSEDGLLQTGQDSQEVDLDSNHPATVDIYVDEGVSRIDKYIMKIRCKRFRATTRGGASGGSVVTTPSGGGTTSLAGGGSTSEYSGDHTHKVFDAISVSPTNLNATSCGVYRDRNGTDIYLSIVGADATPDKVTQPIYTVGSSSDHAHTIYAHQHSNPDHQHSLDTSHQHSEIWGITEDTLASNLTVSVNNIVVATGLNGSDIEIDIADHLIIGQWNEVKFESQSNGRLSWTWFSKTFNTF